MEPWLKEFLKNSSVKLPDGGDSHFHPWKDDVSAGITVTTRIPGGLSIHQDVRDFYEGPGVAEPMLRPQAPAFREAPVWSPPPLNPML